MDISSNPRSQGRSATGRACARRRIRSIFACICLAALCAHPAFAAETVKVGLDVPLTGAAAAIGHYLLWGAEIAVEEVNAQGGVQGKQVELLTRDDATNPERALLNVKELVEKERVVAILGPANSGNALAFIPYLQEKHVPNMILTASATTLTNIFRNQEKNYIFRATLPDAEQLKFLASWATGKFKRVGIASDTTPYGLLGKKDLIAAMAASGLTPVATVEFDLGADDMSRQTKMLKDAGVEAVAVISLGPEIANFIRSADKTGLKATFFGLYPFFLPSIAELPARLSNGLVGALGSEPKESPKAMELDAKVRKERLPEGYYPFRFVVAAYEGTKLLLQAINNAGSLDGEAIRDALEGVHRFKGVSGVFLNPFSKTDHELYEIENLYLGTWEDGEVVRLQE